MATAQQATNTPSPIRTARTTFRRRVGLAFLGTESDSGALLFTRCISYDKPLPHQFRPNPASDNLNRNSRPSFPAHVSHELLPSPAVTARTGDWFYGSR
ncbi:MAG TPA: hypothetical protein DCE43_03785 [Planctomycetaceae bacterium]|nr:hypothetical protein [Planctomycetaceae bacterium]